MPKFVRSWDQGKTGEEDSRLEEACHGPARVAATPVGKYVGLFLRNSLNEDKEPWQVGLERPGSQRRRTPTVKSLDPRSARGRQPSGPRCQVRGDFARQAAHRLKDEPPLSRIDSNFFKRESADSMNQSLPRERVAAPARNIHLQNNSFPRPELLGNTLAWPLGRQEAGGAGVGDQVADHCPRPFPTIVPDSRPTHDLAVASAAPGTRAREGSLCRGLPGGRRGAAEPKEGGDKCQCRRPGARLDRPEVAPSAQLWYSPLGVPPPAALPVPDPPPRSQPPGRPREPPSLCRRRRRRCSPPPGSPQSPSHCRCGTAPAPPTN